MTSTRSRAATIPLIGGRPVLDLVNTVSWRGEPSCTEDHLQEAADCLTWGTRAGVLTHAEAEELGHRLERHPAAARPLTTGLRDLRTAVTETLVTTTTTTAPMQRVEPLILEALAHSHLARHGANGDHYQWAVSDLDQHTPRRRLTLDLLELLSSPHGRVGICADNECQWVFLDTSRAQNRQWCSSTDCGNRYRVRRHQERRTAAASRKDRRFR